MAYIITNHPKNSVAKQPNTPENNTNSDSDLSRMNAEILLVGRFHALTLCRAALFCLLTGFEIIHAIYGFHTSSSMTIMLFSIISPWMLEAVLSPHIKKTTVVLPFLRKHYRYSSLRYAANNVCFFLCCLLLILWQKHNSYPVYPFEWLYRAPSIFLFIIASLRILLSLFLPGHIRRRMLHGKM